MKKNDLEKYLNHAFKIHGKKTADQLIRQIAVLEYGLKEKFYKFSYDSEIKTRNLIKDVERLNGNLASIMIENGIKPIRLQIEYLDRNCGECENSYFDGDQCFCEIDYDEAFCPYERNVKTLTVFSLEKDGRYLETINLKGEKERFYVKRITNLDTNQVLYQYEVKENEE